METQYKIREGDNLTNIAKANNTDVATLSKLNNIANPNLIQTGANLKLPNTLTVNNPVSSTVPAPNLNNVNQLQLPQTPVQTIPVPPQSMADKAVLDTQTQLTSSQKMQESLISDQMKSILGMNAMGTEAQIKQDELIKQGYQQKLQEYNAINSQILQKQAELAQDDIKLISNMRAEERRDTLLPFAQAGQAKLAGDASIMRALKTSEIGVLNAQVLAKQGDIQLAQQMAQDAVDAKFAPFKQQIQTYSDLLKSLDPILSRDEKKQANEQQLRGQIALKEIDRISTLQSKFLANAIEQGASDSVINNITKANTLQDIAKAGKGFEMSKADRLEQSIKQLQYNKLNSELTTSATAKGVSAKDLPLIVKSAEDKVNKIQGLLDNKKGIRTSSGVIKRAAGLSTAIRDWRADIKNVLSDLTVDELGRVKASGVTFGALSEGERKAVGDAATALNSAASLDKEGRLTGYFNISEDKVRQELQTIQDFAKIDFERRTGMKYDDYIALQNQPQTEESYAASLVNQAINSPFNVFGQ